jgi:hypothetical protein
MIDNDYAFELDIDFDKATLGHLIREAPRESDMMPHQRKVEHYGYLLEIKSRYPILGSSWNIYNLKPGFHLVPHIDAARVATVNFPIRGGQDSYTSFFEMNEKPTEYIPHLQAHVTNEDLKEVFKFVLMKPTLIRTDIPHSVQVGKIPRLVFSWGLTQGVDFFQAKEFFKSKFS